MLLYAIQSILLISAGVILIRKRYTHLFYFVVMYQIFVNTVDVFITGNLTNFRQVAGLLLAFFVFASALKSRKILN